MYCVEKVCNYPLSLITVTLGLWISIDLTSTSPSCHRPPIVLTSTRHRPDIGLTSTFIDLSSSQSWSQLIRKGINRMRLCGKWSAVITHQRVNMHYKSLFHENHMKMCWKNPWTFFRGHENSDFGFHGAKLRHEISMKSFTSYFHEPWKVYKSMNMDFHGSWESHIFYEKAVTAQHVLRGWWNF